ncbi:Ubiquitin--protein ligase [Bertholletia excelsa]
MEEVVKSDDHLTSAAAFVEGGIQEACDDTCSICLEEFCESDPSTVTGCKHEFHLQCILEWCQRSSQCPMCWQPISLKDPSSQELLDAIEHEKSFRVNPSRNTTIFHHPTLGDFELQHLPVSATDAELEERIIQHLAAAAAMGRARHIARREGQRGRSSAQGRPQFLVFSTHPNARSVAPVSSPNRRGEGEPASAVPEAGLTSPLLTGGEDTTYLVPQADQVSASASGSSVLAASHHGTSSSNQLPPVQLSPTSQDRAGPSELQSFSESLKSKFNAISMRYKESITKNTRGWKERFFSRSNNMVDHVSEPRSEVNAGIATVSRMMEHLDMGENCRSNNASVSSALQDNSIPDPGNQQITGSGNSHSGVGSSQASYGTASASE